MGNTRKKSRRKKRNISTAAIIIIGIALLIVHADAIHHRSLALALERSRDDLILACVLDGGYTVECRL